jgi:hypothetical protein
MKRLSSIAVLLCAAALTACEKNAVQDITGPLPQSQVRFFNFGVNAPAVNFYANDEKVTAISSATGTESTNGTAYGAVGSGGFYSALEPGQYTFSGRIAAATDKDLAISSAAATIEAGKRYSFYQSGFYNTTTKKADAFVVEDVFPAVPDETKTYIRFVNAISNSQPMALVLRVPEQNLEFAIGAAVPYKNATAFIEIEGGGVADLVTRLSGSSTALITRTAVSFIPGRVYTITARGDMTVTSTTATNRPFLDNTTNR